MRRVILQARYVWLFSCLVFLVSAALVVPVWAQTPNITRVEEDWELVIDAPSPTSDAPQVTCTISPYANTESLYASFMVNHRDAPAFDAGGLQLQTWNGKTLLSTKPYANRAILTTVGEVIRWTQVMNVGSDGLTFEVVNGTSTTWGAFGADDSLKTTIASTLTNLNGYSPAVSVAHSGVTYAGNRVQSLVLKRVRTYAGTDLVAEDTTPKVVHSLEVQP
jgi:hypothetical protein